MSGHEVIDKLYAHTCPHCLAQTLNDYPLYTLAGSKQTFINVLDDVRTGKTDGINADLFNLYNNNYHKAITGVFGDVKEGSKYFGHVEEFKLNTARLAAYKSRYATDMLKKAFEMDPANFDAKGEKILKMFNRWQATEYNTAVARCRTAKQFIQFQETADLYPNLEWLPSRSVTLREEHVKLYGLILPIYDPFWNENQPGNLYNCKCDWQVTDKEPSGAKIKSVTPNAGLDGNSALSGELITDRHPYFRKVDETKDFKNFILDTIVKPAITDYRLSIPQYGSIQVVSENLVTGSMEIIRKSVKEIDRHNADIKVKITALNLDRDVKKWEYLGWSLPEAKHPEAELFLYYKTIINKKERYVNVMLHKTFLSEVPYAIQNGIDFEIIKEGLPKELEKYKNK